MKCISVLLWSYQLSSVTTKLYQEISEPSAKGTLSEDTYSRIIRKKFEQLKNQDNLKLSE